jgi:hypothetical protein
MLLRELTRAGGRGYVGRRRKCANGCRECSEVASTPNLETLICLLLDITQIAASSTGVCSASRLVWDR